MKRYLVIFTLNACFLCLLFYAMREEEGTEKTLTYRFTFVSSPVREGCGLGMAQADEQLGTNTRLTGLRRQNAEKQGELIQKAVYANVDGILTVGGADQDLLLSAAIDQAAEKDIPVLTLGEDLADSRRAIFVGPDFRQAGKQAEDLIARSLGSSPSGKDGEKRQILVLVDSLGNGSQQEAFSAFKEAAAEDAAMENTAVLLINVGIERQSVRAALEDAFDQYQRVQAIYCVSSSASTYVGEILESDGYPADAYTIVSMGMDSRIYECLSKNRYTASLLYDELWQGERAVRALKAYLEGDSQEAFSAENVIPLQTAGADFDYAAWEAQRTQAQEVWELS